MKVTVNAAGEARTIEDVTHWISRDGSVTLIRKMTDAHLAHTLRMLVRLATVGQHGRGESRVENLAPDTNLFLAFALRVEADRRGLDVDRVASDDLAIMRAWVAAEPGRTPRDWIELSDEERARTISR